MAGDRVDAVVVGAGVAGLAAGRALQDAGLEARVLEREARAGGVVRSETVEGFRLERGPNTIRVKAPLLAFLRRHGLDELLERATPASRLRFLVRGGRLVPVPLGPVPLVRTSLLSARGKLRLLAEPFVRRGDPSGESVAEFVTRRLGREALDALVAPFLTGVYAGDERRLGAEAVFPSLVEAERRSGSIALGLLGAALRRRGERGLPGTWSARGGLSTLTEALTGGLGGALATGETVREVARDGREFVVAAEGSGGGSRELRARVLVVATPAREAARLLEGLDPELAKDLGAIEYAPVASVSLAADPERARTPIEGFGFLVPRGESKALLGCLFPSRLFADRAPPGRVLLTALLGGTRHPEALELDDKALLATTLEELDRVLGFAESPRLLALTRWRQAVAQPGPEHPRWLAKLRERLARTPGLELAGAYLEGVALGDALVSGAGAGERALARVR